MSRGRAWKGRPVAALGLVLVYGSSAAARPHLQAVGESSLGYTDNAQAVSANGAQPGPAERGDIVHARSAFLMLSPGVVLALESPRRLQRLAYRYEYDFYFNSALSSSSSNRLDYRAFFELSPRVSLVLGATALESDRFNSVSFAPPGAGAVNAVPTGTGSFLQGAADESFSFDVAEAWRAWQGGNVVADTPIFGTEGPKTVGAGARLGLERSFFADAVGVEARGDYTVVKDGVDSDGAQLGVQRQLSAAGVGLWRHDWGRYLSSSAEAGAARVNRLNTHHSFWTPIGGATLSYATEEGDAQLSYAHTMTTNALVGQTLLVDDVRLRGSLPLTSKGELSLAATCGYQRGRLIDENATLATKVTVILGDVSLGWQATKLLELGVRYQYIRQKSGAETPPLPVSFVQHNVLIGATLKFPPERDMPRPYRVPRRVDRSDEIRDGFRGGPDGARAPGEAAH